MVNVGQQQQKAGEDPPYAGTSGNNRVVTRAPLLRSLASFFASFLRPFLLLPALTTSGFFLGFLLVYPPPESTYPREQLTRNILVPLPSSLLFVLDSGEENYCFSRILLFYHFWNSSGVYGPLPVVTRVVPLALSSCLFVLWEERYLQKYRLQECLCEIERRIRTKRGLRRLVSAKVDNSF